MIAFLDRSMMADLLSTPDDVLQKAQFANEYLAKLGS
jgi:hypothetical protein